MRPFITRHLISGNPNRASQFTGKYDENGDPIIRSVVERVQPGSVYFPADPSERDWLISVHAIREITDTELVLYEDGKETGFLIDVD